MLLFGFGPTVEFDSPAVVFLGLRALNSWWFGSLRFSRSDRMGSSHTVCWLSFQSPFVAPNVEPLHHVEIVQRMFECTERYPTCTPTLFLEDHTLMYARS